MRANRPSRTAEYVAATRGLGTLLPAEARLVDDPWGARWTGVESLRRAGERAPALAALLSRPAWRWLLYMQVRTRALDDTVLHFARSGGRQVVLFGAGLDARALRLRQDGLRFFEVDHPATQSIKRDVVGDAATLVSWDFEHDPLEQLPDRLASLGYDRAGRACVLWEGVTMYLSESAIEASVAMLRALLAPGSTLAFTYFERSFYDRAPLYVRLTRRHVARHGEPWRFGWEPRGLPGWLAERGFRLESDDETGTLARRYLDERYAQHVPPDKRRIALATRA